MCGWASAIENRRFVNRADYLREVPAAVRFISAEPLLGPLEGLDLTDIHWLIAGGESGPRHRPIERSGYWNSGIVVWMRKSCFSSSSGAGFARSLGAAYCKAKSGMECHRRLWQWHELAQMPRSMEY